MLPGSAEQVQAVVRACARDERAVGRPRRRLRAVRRRAADRRRRPDRPLADEAHPRDRPRQRARLRRAGRHERDRVGRGRARLLLSARPVEPDRLLDRRQRRRELRRRALLQVRLHDQLRARARGRARRRRAGQLGGKELDTPGYDLLGAFVGSEGTLGVATKIWLRVVPAPETVKTLVAFFDSTHAAGEAVGEIVARGRRPGRDRDDGRARDRGLRADGPRRLPGRPRRGAAGRARRRRARVRGALRRGRRDLRAVRLRRRAGRARRGRAPALLEDPQGRVPGDGPHLPELLRPGRRDPAHEAARGARAHRRARGASTA